MGYLERLFSTSSYYFTKFVSENICYFLNIFKLKHTFTYKNYEVMEIWLTFNDVKSKMCLILKMKRLDLSKITKIV